MVSSYNQSLWIGVLACALMVTSGWAANGPKQARDVPPSVPAEAYFALVRGDTAREAGKYAEAATAYEDALRRYKRIAADFPEWESDIVQFRIAYCEEQLAYVRSKLSEVAPLQDASGATTGLAVLATATVQVAEVSSQEPSEVEKPVLPEGNAEGEVVEVEEGLIAAEQPEEEIVTDPAAMRGELEYLRLRVAELVEQVSELESALQERSNAPPSVSEDLLKEAEERAVRAEERVRELEEEVRRLSKALGEHLPSLTASQRPDAEYVSLLRDALQLERNHEYRGALAIYEQAAKKMPGERHAILGQVRCLIRIGQLDRAAAALGKLQKAEEDEEALVLKALVEGIKGRYDVVIATLEPLAKRGSQRKDVYGLLGAAWLLSGQLAAAEAALAEAVKLGPKDADALFNSAVLWLRKGDKERAKKFYQESVRWGGMVDPDLERALSLQ